MKLPVFPPYVAAIIAELRSGTQRPPKNTEGLARDLRRAQAVVSLPASTAARKIRDLLRKCDGKEPFYQRLIEGLEPSPHPDDVLAAARIRCDAQLSRAVGGDPDSANIYLAMLAEDVHRTFPGDPILRAGLLELVAGTAWKIKAALDKGIPPPKPTPTPLATPVAAEDKDDRAPSRELSEKELMVIIPRLLELDNGKRSMPSHMQVFKLYVLARLSSTSPYARSQKWAEATIRKRKRAIEEKILRPTGNKRTLDKIFGSPAVFDNVRRQEEAARKRGSRVFHDGED
jgi:hypothetical protein